MPSETANASTGLPGLNPNIPLALARLSRLSPSLATEIGLWAFFRSPRKMELRPEQREVLRTGRVTIRKYGKNRIPVWSWGDGPRVLLLHGWGGRAAQLSRFVAPLVNAGFQAVALDGPAHGEATGRHTSVAHFATTVETLARDLGGFQAAITHSMGATAVTLAMKAGLILERAVFVAPPEDLEQFFLLFLRTIGFSEAHRERALDRASRRYHLPRGGLSLRRNLASSRMPFLVIHDRKDNKASFPEAETFANELPQGQMVATDGLGHNRILSDPDVVAASLHFLQTGASGG